MDSRLSTLITDYQGSVGQAVELMAASGFERPASNADWVCLEIPQIGELSGGISYFKHGYGCAVHLPGGAVNFDFGLDGEIDGFNASRLIMYAGVRLSGYGFSSEAELQKVFDAATNSGEMRFSGDILYYLMDRPDAISE